MSLKQIPNLYCVCFLFGLVSCGNSGTAPAEGGSLASISSSSGVASSSDTSGINTESCAHMSTDTTNGSVGTLVCSERTYKTIVIGTQTWMAENLAFLPRINWYKSFSTLLPRYYVFDYDSTDLAAAKATVNFSTYGVLYNWPAALVACPVGWHLPSDTEWTALENYVGGTEDAGTYLKATSLWMSHTGISNLDSYGFSALPSGNIDRGSFKYLGNYGYFWTASTYGDQTWMRNLSSDYVYMYRNHNTQDYGLSVRCLKDTN